MPAEAAPPNASLTPPTLTRDDVSDRMGPNNVVMGWTHDSKRIVFRSRMTSFNDFIGQLWTVSVDGGLPEQLPLPRGGFLLLLARRQEARLQPRLPRVPHLETLPRRHGRRPVGLRLRHQGDEQLTKTDDQEIIPMWSGNKIYFLSTATT